MATGIVRLILAACTCVFHTAATVSTESAAMAGTLRPGEGMAYLATAEDGAALD